MAICYVCAKSKQYGHNVSHSKTRTKRVFKPNVYRKRMRVLSAKRKAQSAKLNEGGEIKRIKICSKCLKRAKKFGEVRAKDGAVLENSVIKAVDWRGRAEKIRMERIKTDKTNDKKAEAKAAEEKEKEKEEISVEELVGRKSSKKK